MKRLHTTGLVLSLALSVPAPALAAPPAERSNALALVAVDSRLVGALMKDCDLAHCSYRLQLSADGGTTWARGGVITTDPAAQAGPAYGSDQVQGILAMDRRHWFAYGKHLWRSSSAGQSWTRVEGVGAVTTVTTDARDLIAVTSTCAWLGHCRNHLEAIDERGSVTRLMAAWAPSTVGVGQVVRGAGVVLAETFSSDNKPVLLVLRRRENALVLLASRPLPCSGGDPPTLAFTGGSTLVQSCGGDGSAGVEEKQVFRSTDDARSWTRLPDPAQLGYGHELAAGGPGLLWRYGYRSAVYRSSDSGRSWTALLTQEVGDAGGEEAGFAAYGDSAWVAAYAAAYHGMAIYVTHDEGHHWARRRLA